MTFEDYRKLPGVLPFQSPSEESVAREAFAYGRRSGLLEAAEMIKRVHDAALTSDYHNASEHVIVLSILINAIRAKAEEVKL